jgi:hypothetical protein
MPTTSLALLTSLGGIEFVLLPSDFPAGITVHLHRNPQFTRLTNGFSKKLENHGHAVAFYFMHYNFCKIHQTLRVTPAMEAGITDHVWSLEELVALLDAKQSHEVKAN